MITSVRDTNDFLTDKLYEYMVIIGKSGCKKTGAILFLSFVVALSSMKNRGKAKLYLCFVMY